MTDGDKFSRVFPTRGPIPLHPTPLQYYDNMGSTQQSNFPPAGFPPPRQFFPNERPYVPLPRPFGAHVEGSRGTNPQQPCIGNQPPPNYFMGMAQTQQRIPDLGNFQHPPPPFNCFPPPSTGMATMEGPRPINSNSNQSSYRLQTGNLATQSGYQGLNQNSNILSYEGTVDQKFARPEMIVNSFSQETGSWTSESRVSKTTHIPSDQQWVNERFKEKLVARPDLLPQKADTSLKIYELQNSLQKSIYNLAILKQTVDSLSSKLDDTTGVWDGAFQKALNLKEDVEQNYQQCIPAVDDIFIAKKTSKRAKKRERMKQRRREHYLEKQNEMQARNEKHKLIDDSLEKSRLKIIADKKEKEMKKTVDATLFEVKKKISEASKLKELLQSLHRLRRLRADRLKQQGMNTMDNKYENFSESVRSQTQILDTLLKQYAAEESALKNIIEEEQEEELEKEKEKEDFRKRLKEEQEEREKNAKLFGAENLQGAKDFSNPLLPYMEYYQQAETSFSSFVQIRREWDMFIVPECVPGGSRIPDGLVIPGSPSDSQWEKHLVAETDT